MTLNNVLSFIFYFCLASITISNLEANECSKYLNSRSSSSKELSFPNSIIRDLDIDYSAQPKSVTSSNEKTGLNGLKENIAIFSDLFEGSTGTILYPAVGTDAITAFKLFPEANVLIGIDSNPFVNSEDETLSLLDSETERSSYQIYSDVAYQTYNKKRNVVEFIVTDLKSAFPELIIINIKLIKIPSPTNPNNFSYSGKIEFIEEAGGPVKTYYHLHLPFLSVLGTTSLGRNNPDFSSLIASIIHFGFDVVISRASMDFFNLESHKVIASLGFGKDILEYLFNHGGLLVDGDLTASNSAEKMNDEFPNVKLVSTKFMLNSKKHSYYYRFGYLGYVNILRFRIVK